MRSPEAPKRLGVSLFIGLVTVLLASSCATQVPSRYGDGVASGSAIEDFLNYSDSQNARYCVLVGSVSNLINLKGFYARQAFGIQLPRTYGCSDDLVRALSVARKKALSAVWVAVPAENKQGLFYTDKKSPQLIHRRDQMSVAEVNRFNRELATLDQTDAQDALKRRCTGYGFTPDTDAHSRCVMDLVQGDQVRATAASAAQRQRAQQVIKQAIDMMPGSTNQTTGKPARTTCYSRRDWISGSSRHCVYSCLGDEVIQTIDVSEWCPWTITR